MARTLGSSAASPLRLVGAAVALVGLAAAPVAAASQADAASVLTNAEAWYRTPGGMSLPGSPLCDLPTSCGPAAPSEVTSPPSPYTEGTLHVGVAGGREEARTYVTLDFNNLEVGTTITGGTLTLPVVMDAAAGTLSPETATLQACLPTTFVRDGVDGDVAGAPEVDCSVSSAAVFVPGEDGSASVFLVDLAPFAPTWVGTAGSVALVAGDVLPSDSWHAAFPKRDGNTFGIPAISAQLQLAVPAGDGGGGGGGSPVTPTPDVPADPPTTAAPPPPARPVQGNPASFLTETIDTEEAPPSPAVADPQDDDVPVAAPGSEPQPDVVAAPQLAYVSRGLASPLLFVLPLLLLLAAGWVARTFTEDLQTRQVLR